MGLAGALGVYLTAATTGNISNAHTANMLSDLDRLEIQVNSVNDSTVGIPSDKVELEHLTRPGEFHYDDLTDATGRAVLQNIYTDVDEHGNQIPAEFDLLQNYPNPFNPSTTITFKTARNGEVDVYILNSNGQLVRHLVDKSLQAGKHTVQWAGTDEKGQPVSDGVYLARMVAEDFAETIKMVNLGRGGGLDGKVSTIEVYQPAFSFGKINGGEPYVLRISKNDYVTLTDPRLVISDDTGRLTYKLGRSDMHRLGGVVEDHQFKARRGGVINIDGTQFVLNNDGMFDYEVAPKSSHTVKARQYLNSQPYSFIRTIDVPGQQKDLTIRVVDYTGLTPGDTNGVTPEEFKLFARQVNFDNQLNANYEGLKKFNYDSLVIWVAYDNNYTPDTFTQEQQERVRDRFINVILPDFLGRNVKQVYMENRNNPEQNPDVVGARNYAVQRPDNTIPGDGEAVAVDWETDGILDLGGASYRVASVLPTNSIIDEEGATSIGAIAIPTALKKEETIFAAQGATHLTIYDKTFGHILGEITYLPKEHVDRILGL